MKKLLRPDTGNNSIEKAHPSFASPRPKSAKNFGKSMHSNAQAGKLQSSSR